MLVEGVHFDLTYLPLKYLGYKAVAVNVSDICAMNGIAEQITVSIAFSNRFPVEAIDELYLGMREACEKYKVDLVGGDTTSSLSGLVISITAIGKAKKEQVVYRSSAGEHDLIVVSGDLGGEDYELLFTIKQADFDKIKGNPHMTIIGHITDVNDGMYFIDKQGSVIQLQAQGWQHFNS